MNNYFRFFIAACYILVILIIGNVCYTSLSTVLCTSTQQEVAARHNDTAEVNDADPTPYTALAYLHEQGKTDIPHHAMISHFPNQYDLKSALRATPASHTYHWNNLINCSCRDKIFIHPPIAETIDYYIYTLRQILI